MPSSDGGRWQKALLETGLTCSAIGLWYALIQQDSMMKCVVSLPDAVLKVRNSQVNYIPLVSQWALDSRLLDNDYYKCWQGLKSNFDGSYRGKTILPPSKRFKLPAVEQEEGPA